MINFFKRRTAFGASLDGARQHEGINPIVWDRTLARYDFLHGLDDLERARLRGLVEEFLRLKELVGVQGLSLTDEMRVAIAAQASLPILNLGLAPYTGFVGIVVYPGEFRVRREEMDDDGVVHEWDDELAGEAWPGGPVVLSWADASTAEAGYCVVIHEFAHKLDMLTGDADGYPPVPLGITHDQWRTQLEAAYDRYCDDLDRAPMNAHGETEFDLDPYGAEHPAEFFAVMSEMFFTAPNFLRVRYPDLYGLLTQFYRQDPAKRLAA